LLLKPFRCWINLFAVYSCTLLWDKIVFFNIQFCIHISQIVTYYNMYRSLINIFDSFQNVFESLFQQLQMSVWVKLAIGSQTLIDNLKNTTVVDFQGDRTFVIIITCVHITCMHNFTRIKMNAYYLKCVDDSSER